MNKIYKVIWSKVKHQYVVTSEFAHSCTKGTGSRVGKSALAALAAFVLTAGVGGVQAESIVLIGTVNEDEFSTSTPLSTDNVKYVIEGQELDITVTGLNDSGIIGGTASTYGLAIGENSNAYVGGVAVGSGSNASGVNAVAVGRDSHATADGASTFGYHSTANAAHSVALGDFSTATEDNTVSVGNDTLKRRITNVADGTKETDAVNLKQLNTKTAGMVQWDPELDNEGNPTGKYTNDIHGVTLENGTINAANGGDIGGLHVDTAGTMWEQNRDGSFGLMYSEGNMELSGAFTTANDQFNVDADGTVHGFVGNTSYRISNDGASFYNSNNLMSVTSEGVKLQAGSTSAMTVNRAGVDFTTAQGTTSIKGNVITTGTVQGLSNTTWNGTTTDETRAATEGQLAALSTTVSTNNEGVVRWDKDDAGKYVDGSLRGMHFLGKEGIVSFGADNKVLINGTMGQVIADSVGANDVTTQSFTAGNGKVKVGKDGKLSTTGEVLMQNGKGESLAMTDGGLNLMTTDDNGTSMVTVANGKVNLMGGGNTTVTVDGNGTTFGTLTGDAKTTISGGSITTGSLTVDSLTAANGAVKIYDNGIVQAGDKILLNSSMGQVIADSVGANDVTTQSFTAGNGKVKVGKDGKLSTTGEVLMQNGKGESLAMTDGGLNLMTTDDNGTSMVTVANGKVNLMGGGNTTVTVDGNGTTFGTLTGDAKTTISGGSITGLTNQKWNGATDDASRAATEGQLADLSTTVSTNNEGVVRWDTDGDGNYQEGYLTAKHQLIAGGGNLKVDEEGVHLKTADEYFGDSTEPSSYYLDMTNENGISFGHSDGASVTVGENGTTFTYGDQSTIINGNNITTFGANGVTDGQISTGHVYASQDMYIGGNEDANKVATMGDLGTEIGEATEGVVRWDKTTNDKGETIYQEGQLTVDNLNTTTLRAGNGHFYVADDGSFAITNGDNLPTFSVGNDGSMNAAGGKFQVSNTGEVVAQDMYVGSKSETNAVVTKGELDSAVSDMTNNSVQWDDPQTKESINGVGLKDGKVTADTINVGDGALVVDKSGNTTVGGDLNVEGDLKVNGDYVATAGQINDIKTDVSGIKTEIGVDENGNYKTIDNGAGDVITGINNNTSYIKGIKDQIGATGENGALNLSNGATTIEGGINQNTTAIQQNSQAINSLGHRVSDLGDEIDSVGAISAALAGLHPLDYDGTGSKFQISAAMGTYDGTQAAAIGGFYHFNRDVMLSLGGATSFEGDKKTAANIGVTFRVGEGASGKTVSNDILARLEAMDQKIAALEQENKELKNVLGAIDTSLSKEFPDVPANHWAYEAVTKLAGNDVVDGYPDGEFHGDRTMTRYEMAEIIYKAMNRGAKVDQKLVEEFKPEMEQVAANETAQAQSAPAQEAPAQDAQ